MTDAIGGAFFEVGADASQFRDEMRSTRNELGRSAASWSRDTRNAAANVTRNTQRMAAGSGKALDGMQASISATGAVFSATGSQIGSQVASVTSGLAGLTAGLGPVAVGVIGLTVVVTSAVSVLKFLRLESDQVVESLSRQAKATERLKAVTKAADALRRQDAIAASGTSPELFDAFAERRRIERDLETARRAEIKALNDGAGKSVATRISQGIQARLQKARDNQILLVAQLDSLDRDIARLEKEQADKRAKERAAEQKRATEDADKKAKLENDQAEAMAKAERERDAAAKAAIEARDDALFRQADEFYSATEDLQLSAYDRERRRLERARDLAIADARERGELTLATEAFWDAQLQQLRAKHEQEEQAAAQRERDRAAEEADQQAAAELAARTDLADQVRELEAELDFDLAQMGRDETEQKVAELERQHAVLLERARAHGVDVEDLERKLAEKVRRIRESAAGVSGSETTGSPLDRDTEALVEALSGDDFGAGAEAGLFQSVKDDLKTVGQIGADVASNLQHGFTAAFTDFITGAASAKEAGKAFATQFIADTTAMIAQQLVLRAIMGALFPSGQLAAPIAANVPGAALGGSFKVGGFGGPDSQLAMLRVSPGERIDVSPPGKSGGGDIHIHDHVGVGVQTERSPDRLDDMVIRIVARDAARNGPGFRAIQQAAGLRRQGRPA